jgi:hypothetical protein
MGAKATKERAAQNQELADAIMTLVEAMGVIGNIHGDTRKLLALSETFARRWPVLAVDAAQPRTKKMKKLLAAAVVVAFATPSHAIYTECTVTKDTETMNRPGGRHEPRWPNLKKGGSIAIRDIFQDWVFVTYFTDQYEYGWVPRNALINCQSREGTP